MEKQFLEKDSSRMPEISNTVSDPFTAWNRFAETGRVEDYLTYCQAEDRIREKKES